MGQRYVIDLEARFTDHVSGETGRATKSLKDLGKAADLAQHEIDDLNRKRTKPIFDADDSKLLRKIRAAENRMAKLGRTDAQIVLTAADKATHVLGRVTNKLQSWANRDWRATLALKDGDTYHKIQKVTGAAENLTKRAWTATVKIKDLATAPLRLIRNSLFSIQSLVMTIGGLLAAKQLIAAPINLADQYSGAKIGFQTLLGDSGADVMMDKIDQFAKATPFKTSGVISNVQKMMAYGWDVDRVIEDMETIGDAAAATGKGDEGLASIVYALSEIRSKGKLSTQELNQLASAGIKAKAYLAEGLGLGTSDAGMKKLAEILEKGELGANQAIDMILEGMKEFNGMMDATANETVSGLKSQLEDVFEINIARKWGQGLQDGAKRGFGSIVELLDTAQEGLEEFGDTLYEIGKNASNWVADKLENTVKRITDITGSFEFKNADLKEKISMLWRGAITDPLKEWWEGGGQQRTAETAGKIGAWLGGALSDGLISLFGVTDVLDDSKMRDLGESGGMSLAQSFAKSFKENFDGSAVTEAFLDAIRDVWKALPAWGKLLLGGYVGGKAAIGLSNVVTAAGTLIGSRGVIGAGGTIEGAGGLLGLIGNRGVVKNGMVYGSSGLLGMIGRPGYGYSGMTGGSGVLGGLSKIGYKGVELFGGAAATMAPAMATLGGAGAVAGGATLVSSGIDLYRGYTNDDATEAKASKTSGWTKLGGVATGAALGAMVGGPLGALIGAGIGGVTGWLAGDQMADDIRAARYESEEMREAIKDSDASAEQLAATFDKAVWQNMKNHMGDLELSLSECERLADQIVWGDDMSSFEQFNSAVKSAEANLKAMKAAAEDTGRWMWKAKLGVKFNEDEKEAIVASFYEYINSAKSFVENKHYEFTAGVSLLVDVESEAGKSIIESGNAFFAAEKEKVDKLGKELSEAVQKALEDGVISTDPVTLPDGTIKLSEAAEIASLQQQIAEITQKLADAEMQAELELIKLKFGGGNLDLESFNNFMGMMQQTLSERLSAEDEAFIATVSNIKMRLAEDGLSDEEKANLNSQLQTLLEGYAGNVDGLKAEIKGFELDIIDSAYGEALGKDSANVLSSALQKIIDDGYSNLDWGIDDATLAQGILGNIKGLEDDTAVAIAQMLSAVAQQLEVLEVDANLEAKLTMNPSAEQLGVEVAAELNGSIPKELDETVTANIVAEKQIENNIELLKEDFGIPESKAENIVWEISGVKTIEAKVEYLAKEFGIENEEAHEILWKLSGLKQVAPLSVTAADFGIKSSYTFSPTVRVNPIEATRQAIGYKKLLESDYYSGQGYRGGIFGGDSAMDAFARGGRTDGGIVGGSTRFIRVNEESPEMIIPLSSQRRERALDLWYKTGEMLGVDRYARGGYVGGQQSEGYSFQAYDDRESGGQIVQVDMGGVTVQINVDATGGQNVVEAIREQAPEIAEMIAGIINDAIAPQFENTPTKGGAA